MSKQSASQPPPFVPFSSIISLPIHTQALSVMRDTREKVRHTNLALISTVGR